MLLNCKLVVLFGSGRWPNSLLLPAAATGQKLVEDQSQDANDCNVECVNVEEQVLVPCQAVNRGPPGVERGVPHDVLNPPDGTIQGVVDLVHQ